MAPLVPRDSRQFEGSNEFPRWRDERSAIVSTIRPIPPMRLSACMSATLLSGVLGAQQPVGLGARIDSALASLQARGFSGSVRIERRGSLLLERGYGLANREERLPFGPRTVVQIGSNTKDFTAVALLQLHERGALDVNDSLGKFFPAAPTDKRGITLWQLVTHRGGFPIGLGGDFEPLSREQLVTAALQRPLTFPPGTRQGYSNTGYSLLAAVIETVSGATYDDFVRANILEPLQMHDTGLLLPGFDARRLAHGYQSGTDNGTMLSKPHAQDGPYWNLRGNGGMLSTLDDMHTFYSALFGSETLLKAATRNRRFNPEEPIALAGSDLISSFLYERDPRAGVELIIASNSTDVRQRVVRDAIARIVGLPSVGAPPLIGKAVAPTDVRPPAPAFVVAFTAFIRALNAADTVSLRQFVDEHVLIEPGTPSASERVQRMMAMHSNLGVLTLGALRQTDATTVEASLTSAVEGAMTMKLLTDGGSPLRIKGIQVLVGG